MAFFICNFIMNKSDTLLEAIALNKEDIPLVISYWYSRTAEELNRMGADISKMPPKAEFEKMLIDQLHTDYEYKKGFATIWQIDGISVGHCNINYIHFGSHANMHLHIWKDSFRKKGYGEQLVKLSISHFFKKFDLQYLICEPYAKNPAPNKTLAKIGFKFEKNHTCIPGNLNFEQEVSRWILSREDFLNWKFD